MNPGSTTTPNITLSVVSHGHGKLIAELFADIRQKVTSPVRVILTINRPEPEERWAEEQFPFEITVVRNSSPKGFGANHNAALAKTQSEFFCVLNPDIRLETDPFPVLASQLTDEGCGAVAPLILGPDLSPEDHARDFPSVFALAAKAMGRRHSTTPPKGEPTYHPDWIAGMFMVFRSAVIRSVGGFDERYFLYYEDVDLCARLRENRLEVTVCTTVSAIHAARRESRRNLRFAAWHLRSALRFLASYPRMALGFGRRHP